MIVDHMKEKKTDTPLKDQDLLFAPEPDQLALPGDVDPETDLDIIANTYRAIVDQHAFEKMIASWNAKLDRVGADGENLSELSGSLLRQLAEARETLEVLDIPAENDPLSRAILDVAGPAVVLAPDGRIAVTNVSGTEVFGRRQGMFFDVETIDPRSEQDFLALRKAANASGNRSTAILRILPKGEEDKPIMVEAFLLEAPGQEKSYIAIRSLEIEWTAEASRRLGEAFGLSDAEVQVGRLFYELRSIEGVARERNVSLHTVRTQIKAIQAKLEAPTQADIIRLLAMIASRVIMGQRGTVAGWRDPLGREVRHSTPDGRVVAWTWMGAENGLPAVMLRGFPMGYLLPEEAENKLRAAGVKLYALSRPGYGNSSLHGDLPVLEDNLAALRVFLDQAMEGPCIGIGMSNGLVPLLAEQQANPDRFSSLIAIGYTGVLDRSGMGRLPLIQKTMMRMTGYAPWLVELMAKSGHRMMQQHGVDWYLERAYRDRPCDMATYADPNIVPLLRNACAHLLMQGHTTFVRDLQLARAPVDDALDTLAIPLLWLAPKEDGVFDEKRYRRTEGRNSHIRMEPVPKTGELIFYQNTSLVIDRVIQAVVGDAKDTD
jgi:DNA-binding CsgD family transcriptional regulator/pimeloyl-ACP methyl ester carboxylesterase